jgi:ribonuclease BN (tRNA processing enzyme)
MVTFIREADVLLHDAQYTKAELPSKLGWGHSSTIDSVDFAIEGNTRRLLLYHHDPARTDEQVAAMADDARAHAAAAGSSLVVEACVEGTEVVLT